MRVAPEPRRLFDDTSTEEAFRKQRKKALEAVRDLPSDALAMSSQDAVVRAVVADYRLDSLTLHWDARSTDSVEPPDDFRDLEDDAKFDGAVPVQSTTVIIEFIPFSGRPAGLFDMRPSNPPGEPLRGSVRDGELVLTWSGVNPDEVDLGAHFRDQEVNLAAWVAAVNRDVDDFNADLRRRVRFAVNRRFRTHRSSAEALVAVGLPLRRDRPAPSTAVDTGRRARTIWGEQGVAAKPRRRAGRPDWTREVFEERLAEAERLTRPPHTDPRLVRHFRGLDDKVGELSSSWLGRLRRRFADRDE